MERGPVAVDLGLQGGGAHGAFTWGVLDRLLEETWLRFDGISGTSAGAMNAVVMTDGLAEGGPKQARVALEQFWKRVSDAALLSPLRRGPLEILTGRWTLDYSPVFAALDIAARVLSPYDTNPFGSNPLRQILADSVRFDRVARAPIKLFVTATNVRTGRGRVFRNADLTPDVLLASACLPTMFQAVEIDGEAYWDGGYSGNPSLSPLIRECSASDTILVQINPIERPGTPRTAREIHNRLNEVAFNATLIKEFRAAALLRQVADPGTGEGAVWAKMRIHRIASDAMLDLGYSSKLLAEWEFFCMLRDEGRRAADGVHRAARRGPRRALDPRHRRLPRRHLAVMGLAGILLGLGALVWLSFRGWSVLILAPAAGLIAALAAGEPLLAHWTQTFMGAAAGFFAQFFPLFLLGAIFGKLMEDSGSVAEIAQFMTEKLGVQRAVLAVVLAGALVTYGGVSLFVAFFVLGPMAQALFRAADIPGRLMPAAIALGTSTFTMTALPGTPAIQNAIPMPFFGTTPFAAPGLGVIAAAIMLGFGLWWLARAEAAARRKGEGYGTVAVAADAAAEDPLVRERATTASSFDPPEVHRGRHSERTPGIVVAVLPLVVVVLVNLAMSIVILPRLNTELPRRGTMGRGAPRVGERRVVGRRRTRVRDRDARAPEPRSAAVGARNRRRRRERLGPAGPQRREPRRLRRRRGRDARVCGRARLGAVDRRRVARLARRIDHHSLRTDRFGIGRHDDRARRARRHLPAHGRGARHRSGAPAPRRSHRRRHARHPAPQRRRHHAARRVRIDAPGKLLRHRDRRYRRASARAGGGDCARVGLRLVLTAQAQR